MNLSLRFFLLLVALPVGAQSISDGPYLQYQPERAGMLARWVCDNQPVQQFVAQDQQVPARCGYDQPLTISKPLYTGWQFHSKRFAAISDIHGQYSLMLRLLQAAGIIDAKHHWSFGQNHLVIVGDLMDRGDKVNEALWTLYSLQQQALQAGGAVHLLPGNHETMVLRGDLRYVHPQYQQVATTLNTQLPALYGQDTVLGQWLRRLPLFIRINDTLFVHGGISADMTARPESCDQLHYRFQQSWGLDKAKLQTDDMLKFLHSSQGPLWFRGYFRNPDKSVTKPDALRRQLAGFGARQIVVGHTSMDDVYRHHGGLVYSVDSSIKNGKSGAVLHYIDGKWFRSGLDGSLTPVRDAPEQLSKNND